jgi:outer membrane receptor protein involved in Fe transport
MKYIYNSIRKSEVILNRLASTVILCFISNCSFAQTSLKGTIKDSTSQEALIGVVVSVDSIQNTTTDLNGHYKISVSAGRHHVTYTYITYRSKSITVNASGDEVTENMVLQPESQGLQMTVVSASMYGKNIEEENVSMQVLKGQTLQDIGIREVDEGMDYVPGVSLVDQQVNIRGGSGWTYGAGSRVLLLVDGLPELTPDASDVIWDFIPLEQIQQIEVIKGASSVLYGSGALDGVINVRTAWPTSTPVTTIGFYQGLYSDPSVPGSVWWNGVQQPYFNGLSFMHSHKFGQFDLILSGNLQNEVSYEQGANDQRVRLSLSARYRFKHIDGLMAGVKTSYMYQNDATYLGWANDSTGILKPLGGDTGKGSTLVNALFRRLVIDPFVDYYTPDGSRFSLQGRYFLSSNVDYGSNKGSIAQSYYYEFRYQKKFNKLGLTLTAGAVESKDIVNADLYGNRTEYNQAAYLQLEKKLLHDRLTLTGGVRYETDKVDSTVGHSPVVFRAGVNYKVGPYTYLRASYGEGYRFPSIAEKYVNTSVGALQIFPNPLIRPETGYSSEIGINQGVKMGSWMGYIDLALFETQYKDLIDFEFGFWPPPGTPPNEYTWLRFLGFQSVNVENALVYGADFSYTAAGKLFGTLPAKLIIGFTPIEPINLDQRDSVNKYESAHPGLSSSQKDSLSKTEILNYRSLYSAKLGFEITYKKLTFGANVRYNSFMVNMDGIFVGTDPKFPGVEAVPGVEEWRKAHHTGDYLVDLHLAYQASDAVKVSFIVKNLFNRAYMVRPALLGAPQNFTIQANIRI